MSYLGKGLKSVSSANITVDTMIGDGVVNTLALSQSGVESVKDVSVYYQGVAQVPNVDYTLTASTVTFTSIPTVGMKVVVVTRGDSVKDRVNDNSVTGASFADNAITDSNVIGLDASKLTGALPAMDGSALTNASLPTAPLTSSASDPTNEINGTLGDIWTNTTTGQMFVLTDATTDQNVWTNAGNGDGNIIYVEPWAYGGTVAGFQAGGRDMAGVDQNINKIDFSTGSNSSLGVKTLGLMWGVNGNSSATHGYIFGGSGSSHGSYSLYTEKFSFTTYAQSGNIANLSYGCNEPAGHNTEHHGWRSGGGEGGSPYRSNRADKISFASDTSWTHTNTLNYIRKASSGMSSLTHGYTGGGHVGNPTSLQAVQEKFSFSSNGGSTNVADLIQARETAAGCSSGTHGYSCGGWSARIERINFSNDNEQTDVAMLSPANHAAKGASSSTTHGYLAGGWYDDTVSKFSFASATPSIELLPNIPHHAYHGASGLQY